MAEWTASRTVARRSAPPEDPRQPNRPSVSAGGDPPARRVIRQLDTCLTVLEEAHERGERRVSRADADALAAHLPGIHAGMGISDAISAVLKEQAHHLKRAEQRPMVISTNDAPSRGRGADDGERPSPATSAVTTITVADGPREQRWPATALDEEGARALTERIRSASIELCILLLEAHDRRAWSALGYRTWAHYVRAEFKLSRSRSYELLDQGRVRQALRLAAGMSGTPDISGRAAGEIKGHLVEATRLLRLRAASSPPENLAAVTSDVVGELRRRSARERASRRGPESTHTELDRICTALDCLAGLAPPADVVSRIPLHCDERLAELENAAAWLRELAVLWRARIAAHSGRHRDSATLSQSMG